MFTEGASLLLTGPLCSFFVTPQRGESEKKRRTVGASPAWTVLAVPGTDRGKPLEGASTGCPALSQPITEQD